MSKRSLLILILLLAVIDIVAGFWYLAARIETSGDSRDIFSMRDDSITAVLADTISEINVPDSFMIAERHAYYVSNEPAVKNDVSTYLSCVKRVKIRWPKSVNGSDDIASLHRALLHKMFASGVVDLEDAVGQYLSLPVFTSSQEVGYKRVDGRPTPQEAFGYESTILAYPVMTSMHLLVMGVDKIIKNGNERVTHNAYVHYDRSTHRLLNKSDIFAATDDVILGIINAKIDLLNQEKDLHLEHSMAMPSEYQAKARGISFHFPAGIVAAPSAGPVELFVDYKTLNVVFTQPFRQLVSDNEGYWDYKHLTP